MPRSPLRNQFMPLNSSADRRILPLTMEQILDDRSFDPPEYDLDDTELEGKSFPLLLAPPSTPINHFDHGERDHEPWKETRGRSFSSDRSSPDMVEDYSGISDSDIEPALEDHSPEATAFLWRQYERIHLPSPEEISVFCRLPPLPTPVKKSPMAPYKPAFLQDARPTTACRQDVRPMIVPEQNSRSTATSRQETRSTPKLITRPKPFPGDGKITPVPDSIFHGSTRSPRRPRGQRKPYIEPERLESIPLLQPRQTEIVPRRSFSRPPQLLPEFQCVSTDRQHPFYRNSPYSRPSTTPCNSSQPFSFHNTPPLPRLPPHLVEKSVFEYDSDDERNPSSSTPHLSSTFAAKLHLRSISLGTTKLGLGRKASSDKGGGRRRSASEIVRGVFGIGKK